MGPEGSLKCLQPAFKPFGCVLCSLVGFRLTFPFCFLVVGSGVRGSGLGSHQEHLPEPAAFQGVLVGAKKETLSVPRFSWHFDRRASPPHGAEEAVVGLEDPAKELLLVNPGMVGPLLWDAMESRPTEISYHLPFRILGIPKLGVLLFGSSQVCGWALFQAGCQQILGSPWKGGFQSSA